MARSIKKIMVVIEVLSTKILENSLNITDSREIITYSKTLESLTASMVSIAKNQDKIMDLGILYKEYKDPKDTNISDVNAKNVNEKPIVSNAQNDIKPSPNTNPTSPNTNSVAPNAQQLHQQMQDPVRNNQVTSIPMQILQRVEQNINLAQSQQVQNITSTPSTTPVLK